MIIQIIGLPGSGKTSLAVELADRINAVHLNADYVRSTINSDLGFSPKDRIEHARRMGEMSRMLSSQGHIVVVDFICPTKETREAFGKPTHLIWMDRIEQGRFEDTNKLWENPTDTDLTIEYGLSVVEEVDLVISKFNLYDWKKPTALMIGRYQPWHEGHQALWEKANEKTGQTVIAVRHTQGTSEKDPFDYEMVAERIRATTGSSFVVKLPNITNIVYGRDVGYKIEQIDLGSDIHAISATQKRKDMGL
jgi:adenylylsulfate kinase